MESQPARETRIGPLFVMLLAVLLQVAGAIVLKTLADRADHASLALAGLGIAVVVALNLLRLGVWGVAHRRYPLSRTFPLSALFFPAMLLVALAYGEETGARQIAGAVLITGGASWLTWQGRA
jgi:drug/metabolite transporter (DMT)-like permease